MTTRKGIILAGGSGTRLHPITMAVSKQLLPIYDKPCIYYSLSTLMLAGIRQILLITNPEHIKAYKKLLQNGSQFGVYINYIIQDQPRGLADAYLLAEQWLNHAPSAMILGDNLFHGTHFGLVLKQAMERSEPTIFGAFVGNPERFGVPSFQNKDVKTGLITRITEKPRLPDSPFAITGLYFLPPSAPTLAKQLTPSERGELEITDLLSCYIAGQQALHFEDLGRGFCWMDVGSIEALHQASVYVQVLQTQQRIKIGDPFEVAYRNGWIKETKIY